MAILSKKSVAAAALAGAVASAGAAGPYAVFQTSEGKFTVELFPEKAPKTVENFISLAKGTKEWTNPRTNAVMKDTPLYDGTVFHRTIPGFMIQGGDPLGNGRGGPGYKFADEFSDLRFDKPGLLAMANSGPNSNGSQFFVTVGTPSHLNNRHTIFGQVVEGYEVVEKIANKPSGPNGQVQNPVKLEKVDIVDSLGSGPSTKAPDEKTAKADKATTAGE